MRFTTQAAAAALLADVVLGHPTQGSASEQGLEKRPIDISAYKLGVGARYANNAVTTARSPRTVPSSTYTRTASAFVKSTFPGAEFRMVSNYLSNNGMGHVAFKQTVHGIDIDTADFNVNVAKDGSVFSYGNSFYSGAVPSQSPLVKRDQVGPVQALKSASSILQLPVTADSAKAVPEEGLEHYTITGSSGAMSDPKAHLVYYEVDDALSLAWRVETDVSDNWLISYVDAISPNQIFGVVDYVTDASYTVYPWKTNDPTKGGRIIESDPWDPRTSEFTWHSNNILEANTTVGNNGRAQANLDGDSVSINDYRPIEDDLNFNYEHDLSATDPQTYLDASVAQLFYTANMYHDLLYVLGFDEAAGNFEANNNGQGGLGNDPVTLNAQDGSGLNNANFATPPDGQVPRMRMYIWTLTTPWRDCSFDAGVVIHEYTHGLSNRLTGGPSNTQCLGTTEAGGMGEGWSDFMAIAIHLKTTDTRETDYPLGDWVFGKPGGIRKFLYSTNMKTNPMVYTTANNSTLVHFIGTIWASTLYEVLWNLIDEHGITDNRQPNFERGVPTDGRFLAMQLVLNGMKLQPCRPDFIQARDAIIDADKTLTGGANKCVLWKAFAKRGLGVNASRSIDPLAHESRVDSYDLPEGVCGCNSDACLSAMRASDPPGRLEESQEFCSGFTKTVVKKEKEVVEYLQKPCEGEMVSRVSSACACIPTRGY